MFILTFLTHCVLCLLQHEKLQSAPGSRVGTPAYLAPEVILTTKGKTYDGKVAIHLQSVNQISFLVFRTHQGSQQTMARTILRMPSNTLKHSTCALDLLPAFTQRSYTITKLCAIRAVALPSAISRAPSYHHRPCIQMQVSSPCMQGIIADMFSGMHASLLHDTMLLAKTCVSLGNSLLTHCHKQFFVIAMSSHACASNQVTFMSKLVLACVGCRSLMSGHVG